MLGVFAEFTIENVDIEAVIVGYWVNPFIRVSNKRFPRMKKLVTSEQTCILFSFFSRTVAEPLSQLEL